MPPDRWQQISQIYHAALGRSVTERAAFLAEACPGDDALRREVESLLEQGGGAIDFLSDPALAMAASMLGDSGATMLATGDGLHGASSDASRLEPGQLFGPYRIERLLGRGGMGEVYEAEHVEHGRRVALKVLRHSLSGPADRARFLREGQLAASVSHPHIVYIYGSEEIAGIPVIAMELLPGGTLKDRIDAHGPLTPGEAIDAILQVISGLEAAHDAGILHRDIKPSNCFVDGDGTIKIGDFGLSIPLLGREVTQLTTTGVFQGTPQFASPEHLRGQPLDVRSDIYAVGATLHCLLTGQPPFEDGDLMVLVSRIATEAPLSLRKERPDIPTAVAAVVLQCLAKDAAHRPASYASLSSVLEPLSSMVRTPARLGIRFVAAVMDVFFAQVVLIVPIYMVFGGWSPPAFGARPVWQNLVEVAYFAIAESVWGASLGKALCGIRVVSESGARPRFAQALLRALFFVAPRWFASGMALVMTGVAYSQRPIGPWIVTVADSVVGALMFAAARRVNGFAGFHEMVSRTRTVVKSPTDVRRIVVSVPRPIEIPPRAQLVGPYVLADASSPRPNGGAALGYDESLQRSVWLRFPALDSNSVSSLRRSLRRPARLRWLAGQRTSELAWDAYEQVPGQSFDTLLTQRQPWATVRGWLHDLAEEVHAGLGDGSLPVIDLDRVWIGTDGRARLLDWPVPGDRPDPASSAALQQTIDLPQAERFLFRVGVSALEGRVLAGDTDVRVPRVPLPLSATDCLAKLGAQHFESSEAMLTAVASAARGPAAVPRPKRAAHLAVCAIPAMLMLVLGLVSLDELFVLTRADPTMPRIAELVACLNRLEEMDNRGVPSADAQYRALELYIAGRHRDLVSNPPIWSRSPMAQRVISTTQRVIATRLAANVAFPRQADVDEAARTLRPFLDRARSGVESAHPYVRSVNDGDVADRAGVKVNDVVIALDGEPLMFAAQLVAAIRRHPDQLIILSILRDGQPLMIEATPARRANQGLIGIGIANEELREVSPRVTWRYLWLHAIVGLMCAATLGLLSALAVRGGLALRLLRMAVVTRTGTLASGSRARLRAVLSWVPVLAACAATFAGRAPLLMLTPQARSFFATVPSLPPVFPGNLPPIFFTEEPSILSLRVAIIAVAVVVFGAGAISAMIRPERGLQDRLAGTWLVPR